MSGTHKLQAFCCEQAEYVIYFASEMMCMQSDLRRTWAEVDMTALRYNYETIRQRIGPGVKLLGIVKADAYGHGAVPVARKLAFLGIDYLAVSSLDEARELRDGGLDTPILILGHTPPEQVGQLIDMNITQSVTCEAKAIEYNQAAAAVGRKLRVHIKVDTGMSRLGFLVDGHYRDEGAGRIAAACRMPFLNAEGIFTHFAVSDEEGEENEAYTRHQFNLFRRTLEDLEKMGISFALRHCANTGAVANYPEMALDMVRPGLLLYGYGAEARRLGLKSVMREKTTISTIKTYEAGTSVSYGRTYVTDRRTRVGVLPIGYADGLFRCLSNRYAVSVRGVPAPIIGRICMDMCMVDLTAIPDAEVGDEVTVFGPDHPIEEMAEAAGTIPYELLCSLPRRVPRVYLEDGQVVFRELKL